MQIAKRTALIETLEISKQIWCEFLVDLEENILEIGHGYAVGANVELIKPLIQRLEEASEVLGLVLGHNKRDFLVHLTSLLHTAEVRSEELFKSRVRLSSLLDKGQLVANSESILEE